MTIKGRLAARAMDGAGMTEKTNPQATPQVCENCGCPIQGTPVQMGAMLDDDDFALVCEDCYRSLVGVGDTDAE